MALTTVRPQGMGFNTGRRNMVINGAMQVAQRGTSYTATGSGGYFTVDRWRYTQYNGYGGDIEPVMSQSTDTPNNTFKNSFKFAVTTGTSITGADAVNIDQHIEGQDIVQLGFGSSDAKSITLSFWVKASVTGTYCVTFNSGESYSASRTMIKEYTISTANTWEYKTVTTAGDTSGTWVDTTAAGLGLCFTLSNGSGKHGSADTWLSNTGQQYLSTSNQTQLGETSGATWFITGVQLEVGENASDFEHRSYGEKLALCQRYFYRWVSESNYGNLSIGVSINTTKARGLHTLPVEMRSQPTFSSNGTFRVAEFGGHSTNTTAESITRNHKRTPFMNWTVASGLTNGKPAELGANNDDDAFCDFDAEL